MLGLGAVAVAEVLGRTDRVRAVEIEELMLGKGWKLDVGIADTGWRYAEVEGVVVAEKFVESAEAGTETAVEVAAAEC